MIDEIDRLIGQQIHFYRQKIRWPLKVLAEKIGVSLQQLQRYEQGVNKVPASLLVKIAKEMDLPIHHFFENPQSELGEHLGYRLMIAEDDPQESFLIQKALENYKKPLEIFTVSSEKDVTDSFRSWLKDTPTPLPTPNFVLLDVHDAVNSHLNVLRFIKSNKAFHHIPVIILLYDFHLPTVKMLYESQAASVIKKSFCFHKLKKQLHLIMDYWMESILLDCGSNYGKGEKVMIQ